MDWSGVQLAVDISDYRATGQEVEIPLQGGNLSQVLRVGDTVRRNAGPWTPAVHALLRHLEDKGFQGAPHVHGIDPNGREVLTYFEGDVFGYPMPDFVWSEETLVAVARLLRNYHDAVRSFVPPPDATWQVLLGAPTSGPIVCHNDIAPYNTVFREGTPVGFIDWDTAAPGPALYDVAVAAWRWVPLQDASWAPVQDQPGRLLLFCDAYGLTRTEREQLLPFVRQSQQAALDTIETWGPAGKPGWDRLWRIGHADAMRDCLVWVEENMERLLDR